MTVKHMSGFDRDVDGYYGVAMEMERGGKRFMIIDGCSRKIN